MQDAQPTTTSAVRLATRWAPTVPGVLAVRGTDPVTGRPTTWYVTPRVGEDGTPAGHRVELADVGPERLREVPRQRS